MQKKYDVIIIGAGASGLTAARAAIANGRSVAVFDMGDVPARKVAVSGGGRCNFTNMAAARDRYFGQNPDFIRGAIATVTPSDILDWMNSHNLKYIEKSGGQYFCASGAADVVDALMNDAARADIFFNTTITNIEKNENEFMVYAKNSIAHAKSIIIASGGISFPALGVSGTGYVIAKKFGHKIIPPCPGLVGLKTNEFGTDLAGLSLPVKISIGKKSITDSLLFTHFGIGGPVAMRASLLDIENGITIDFAPNINAFEFIKEHKIKNGKKSLGTILSLLLPARLAKWFVGTSDKNIADYKDLDLKIIADGINDLQLPVKRLGLESAEVVTGGVSTEFVSSKTFESKLVGGLFFAGEVLDIAGDLGGFNLHFAFASGIIAGRNA